MKTTIYTPDTALRPFVKSFLILEGEFKSNRIQPTIPKGEPALFFPFNKPSNSYQFNNNVQVSTDLIGVDKPMLMGQSSVFGLFNWSEDIHVIIVPMFPHTLSYFIRESAKTVTNCCYSLELLGIKSPDNALKEKLWEASSANNAIQLVEQYLLKSFYPTFDRQLPTCVKPVLEWIERNQGLISIKDVASKFKISTRRLEQQFMDQIGISPIKYSRIIKFRSMIKAMLFSPKIDLFQLEEDFKYYDHSHLIRDFKQLVGMSPKAYFENIPDFDGIALLKAF